MNAHTLLCGKKGEVKVWKAALQSISDVAQADYEHFSHDTAWVRASLKLGDALDCALMKLVLHELPVNPLLPLGFVNVDEVSALMEVDAMASFSLSRGCENRAYVHVGSQHGFDEYMLARCGDCARGFSVAWPMVTSKDLGKLCPRKLTPLLNCNGTATTRTKAARASLQKQVLGKVPLAIVSQIELEEWRDDSAQFPREVLEFPGLAGRVALALAVLEPGGNLIVSLTEVACPCTVELLLALYHAFNKLRLVKPLSAAVLDDQRLLVCEGFKDDEDSTHARAFLSARAEHSIAETFAPTCDFHALVHSPQLEEFRFFILKSSAWCAEFLDAVSTRLSASFETSSNVEVSRRELTRVVEDRAGVQWADTVNWLLDPRRFVYGRHSPWELNSNLGENAKRCFLELKLLPDEFLWVHCIPKHCSDAVNLIRVHRRKVEVLNKACERNKPLFKLSEALAAGFALVLKSDDLKLVKVASSPRDHLLFQTGASASVVQFVESALILIRH
jgi:hypothetical protein